jgi:hypothetical protein
MKVGYQIIIIIKYNVYGKINLSLCQIEHYAMKTYGGVEVLLHAFLALAKGKSGEVHDLAAIPW